MKLSRLALVLIDMPLGQVHCGTFSFTTEWNKLLYYGNPPRSLDQYFFWVFILYIGDERAEFCFFASTICHSHEKHNFGGWKSEPMPFRGSHSGQAFTSNTFHQKPHSELYTYYLLDTFECFHLADETKSLHFKFHFVHPFKIQPTSQKSLKIHQHDIN